MSGLSAGRYGVEAFRRRRGLIFLIIMVVPWLYWALMESSSQQATLGKMALGLKVTDLKGERHLLREGHRQIFRQVCLGADSLYRLYDGRLDR